MAHLIELFDVNTANTSTLRDAAHVAALDDNWKDAAIFMRLAIERHPGPVDFPPYKADLARMARNLVVYEDLIDVVEALEKEYDE